MIAALPLVGSAQKITLGSCSIEEMGVKGSYRGVMASGKPQGKGSVVYENGNTYEGEFVKGKRQGYGVYTFADGEKYEGEWYQDQQHGQGTYYFSNNNRYEGLWYRDKMDGKGTMFYYNGDRYECYKSWSACDPISSHVNTPFRSLLERLFFF